LRIPIDGLDEAQLVRLARTALFDKRGFNPDEPRIPAGQQGAGEWTTGGGGSGDTDSSVPAEGAAPRGDPGIGYQMAPRATVAAAGETSLLGDLTPGTLSALAELAAEMPTATLFLGILFIPTNRSPIVEGAIDGAPDLTCRYDRDTGLIEIWRGDGTGASSLLDAAHIGLDARFVDAGGRIIGRVLPNGSAIVDPDTLPGYRSQPAAGTRATAAAPSATDADNEPKLCPDPTPENISGRSDRTIAYQQQITGLPPGLEIVFNGERYDGCWESNGDLVEAKGEGYANMMAGPDQWKNWFRGLNDLMQQMKQHSDYAADRVVEYYFAEESVASYFQFYSMQFRNIRVFYVPYKGDR